MNDLLGACGWTLTGGGAIVTGCAPTLQFVGLGACVLLLGVVLVLIWAHGSDGPRPPRTP
jgi:hypothetical protein